MKQETIVKEIEKNIAINSRYILSDVESLYTFVQALEIVVADAQIFASAMKDCFETFIESQDNLIVQIKGDSSIYIYAIDTAITRQHSCLFLDRDKNVDDVDTRDVDIDSFFQETDFLKGGYRDYTIAY